MQEDRPKHIVDINHRVAVSSRGIGMDFCSCFICGGVDKTMMKNISLFVQERTDGEVVVDMFPRGGAYLDYRYFEPNWIQVKIGACQKHLPNLIALNEFVSSSNTISKAMIDQAI